MGQFPHIASLQQLPYGHICAAAIISPQWLLTVASCVFGRDPAALKVRVGSIVTTSGGVTHQIAQVRTHAGYVAGPRINDIAAMQTTIPIVFNVHTRAVAVSTINIGVGPASVAGWGEVRIFLKNIYLVALIKLTYFCCTCRLLWLLDLHNN